MAKEKAGAGDHAEAARTMAQLGGYADAAELSRQSDEISVRLDRALVNSEVEYEAPFDVNDTFADVFDGFTKADQPAE